MVFCRAFPCRPYVKEVLPWVLAPTRALVTSYVGSSLVQRYCTAKQSVHVAYNTPALEQARAALGIRQRQLCSVRSTSGRCCTRTMHTRKPGLVITASPFLHAQLRCSPSGLAAHHSCEHRLLLTYANVPCRRAIQQRRRTTPSSQPSTRANKANLLHPRLGDLAVRVDDIAKAKRKAAAKLRMRACRKGVTAS